MDSLLFLILALAHAALLLWGVRLVNRSGWRVAVLPVLVVAALVYDNGVIAAGRLIGAGPVLEGLNAGRFWLHALVTPLLVLWSWDAVRRTGAPWAARAWARWTAIAVAAALVVVELATVTAALELQVRDEYGALSYASDHAGGPPPMVLTVAAVLVAAGVVVWRRQGWPWLFVSAALMTLGSGVPNPFPSGAATNLFEVLLLTGILATIARQDATERHPASSPQR
ncbi:hypothetical protein GCM10009830_19710 [Glycomyces endophyticus]|uniref:Uncharacterized protein n=1 Tax=Glycomyces endophyticus TaxID=480996 RepID=A0ABP4SKV6_9ACTN